MKRKKTKKTSDGKIICKSGISIKGDIGFKLGGRSASFFPLIQLAVTVVTAFSMLFMLESFLNGDGASYYITNTTAVSVAIIMTASAAVISTMKGGFFKVLGLSMLGINAAYITYNIGSAVRGFMLTVYTYSKRASFAEPVFAHQIRTVTQDDLEMFFLAAAFIITLMISTSCIYIINFPLMFIETFPIFELGTFWGWEPYVWTTVGMVGCWVLILSLTLINHTTRRKNSSNTFAVYLRKKSFYLTNDSIKKRFFSASSTFTVLVMTLVFVVTAVFASATDNFRPDNFKQLRREISLGFRDFTNEISQRIENGGVDIPGRGIAVGGTNGGRLGLYNEIRFKGTTALGVTVDSAFARPIYIRGYAGEKYSDNCWDPLKADKDTLKQFTDSGSTILDYDYLQFTDIMDDRAVKKTVSISCVNASADIMYAPYGSFYTGTGKIKKQDFDGIVSPTDNTLQYDLTYSQPFLESWDDTVSFLIDAAAAGVYSDEHIFYDNNVYKNSASVYLNVPEKLRPTLDSIIEQIGIDPANDSVLTKHKMLCDYFRNNYTYDTAPGVTPEGEDFIEYFLTEQKKGYCTYFASAGVMLMREMGIPARYVEGYVIEPEQYSPENLRIAVTDRCAHAWCEIFIPGYGWYPLEFTNSYIDNYNPNLTDKERNITHEDSSSKPKPPDSSSKSEPKPPQDSSSKKQDSSKPETSSSVSSSSKASAPTGVGTTKNKDGSGGDSGTPFTISRTQAYYIGGMAVVVIAALVCIVVRRKSKLDKLERAVNSHDNTKSVISCYTAFLDCVALLGVDMGENLTDVQLSKRLSGELEKWSPGLSGMFMEVSEPAIVAFMSSIPADEQEAARSRNALRQARKDIYDMLSYGKKFTAKWVYGLY